MEKLFEEILRVQGKRTILHRGELLVPKLIYFALNLFSILHPNPTPLLVLITINAVLMASIGLIKALIYSTALWVLTTISVSLVPYITGVYTFSLLKRSLYAYTCFLSLTILFSTTPPEALSKKPFLAKFTLPYVMLRYSVRELRDVSIALKAKGWEAGFNPFRYVAMVINVLLITIVRINTAIESIRARGLD